MKTLVQIKNSISQEIQELILGILIISSALILLSTFLHEKKQPKVESANNAAETQKAMMNPQRIDYHLKDIELNTRIQQFRQELENIKTKAGVLGTYDVHTGEKLDKSRYGIKLKQEYGADDVAQNLERKERDNSPLNVRDKIESQIAQHQFLQDYDQKYEKEFVNYFINNMQQAGYEVQLNDKLEVVRVRKIHKPDSLEFR